MTRAYSARLIALTLDVPLKWIDNLLSHHSLPGVSRSRQGVERRVTDEGLLAIEVVRLLTTELGIPMGRAASMAARAIESRTTSELKYVTESGISVTFPTSVIEARMRARVFEAIEALGRIPRGRPRRHPAPAD